MLKNSVKIILAIFLFAGNSCTKKSEPFNEFSHHWPDNINRTWLGPDFWANRLQDWEINDGRINCLVSDLNRNINLLTCRLSENDGDFSVSVTTGLINPKNESSDNNWIGIRIGAKGEFDDYRDDAIYGKGLNLGVTTSGDLFIGEPNVKHNGNAKALKPYLEKGIILRATGKQNGNSYDLVLEAINRETGELLTGIVKNGLSKNDIQGSLALVSNFPDAEKTREESSCWFDNWEISGNKVKCYPERRFGPILFSQYTLTDGILKMTVQLPPVCNKDEEKVILEIEEQDGNWKTVGESVIDEFSRTATIRVENWDYSSDIPYRLSFKLITQNNELETFSREGIIRKEPNDKNEIVVAAFTGNNDLGFPNKDLVKAIKYHDPDLLFFSGDQIYEGVAGFGVQRSPVNKAMLDYLRKWYIYGWAYGDLLRDRPTVSIPDDHDIYHGNLWGAGGKATPQDLSGSPAQDMGGYKMPAEWVKMVERTQTSHLPDPFDPTPIKQGIGVYYTELQYAGISFAIIEDRKFKSAPGPLLPEAEIDNGWAQNCNWNAATQGNVQGAVLLGQRQLDFLDQWAQDWSGKTWMKVVLSQTIFANVATLPKSEHHDRNVPKLRILNEGEYPPDDRPVQDMDSDGWPQTGRNNAIKAMRKGFALHIAGDQHLGSTIQYGVDQWHDGGFALCVPAISNIWPRRWFPEEPGKNTKPGAPKYTGDFLDGFGNRITVYAVSNPVFTGKKPSNLYDRATGYGIVRFNKDTRDITIECWPRFVDPSKPDARQYNDWPIIINQLDNFGKEAVAYIPEIVVEGITNPVIQIIDETNKGIVYTLRINGNTFRPKVFREGKYTIKIGDPDKNMEKILKEVASVSKDSEKQITVEF
ncbi:MAG: alkaline phosphatase D family protein [Bacteroidetes bacterium]|nr:alkaline phosphatase D family protein [Bacteroidota bacterium]